MYRFAMSVVFTFVIVASCPSESSGAGEITATVGPQETVLPDGAFGFRPFPDTPLLILKDKPLTYYMVAVHDHYGETFLMQGRSLETSRPVRKVLALGPSGAHDANYAGIQAIYYVKEKKRVLAFYHAEDHSNMPGTPWNSESAGSYWTIGLAISDNGGASYEKKGVILSGPPKGTKRSVQGVGIPSVCEDPTGKYLYLFYLKLTEDYKDGICLARCKISDEGKPGSWHKYCNGRFSESGLGGKSTPVLPQYSNASVQFVEEFGQYLMLTGHLDYDEWNGKPIDKSGLYLAHSEDGINWTKSSQLLKAIVSIPLRGKQYIGAVGFHLIRKSPRGASGWLIYSYSPHWGFTAPNSPGYMVKRPIRIVVNDSDSDHAQSTISHAQAASSGGAAEETLAKRLAGTKWINSNGVTFEWTADGRFLHNGKERQCNVLDERRVQIVFGANHIDTLEFDDGLTTFRQLIRGGPRSFTGKRH